MDHAADDDAKLREQQKEPHGEQYEEQHALVGEQTQQQQRGQTRQLSTKEWRKLNNPKRKRHGARNQHRHKAFTKWLECTFPESFKEAKIHDDSAGGSKQSIVETGDQSSDQHKEEEQEQGQEQHSPSPPPRPKQPLHILDVAGGKGETAARLTMCYKVEVVMVDPRKADVADCYAKDVVPKLPKKWQQRFKDRISQDESFPGSIVNARCTQLVMNFTDHDIEMSPDLRQAVQKASLLVGLHADGATEAIVDAALKFGKPFVVVPCCVFPNLFHQRRIKNEAGALVPVRNHEQFCAYLQQKHPDFQQSVLPFDGRNVAIHWSGPDTSNEG